MSSVALFYTTRQKQVPLMFHKINLFYESRKVREPDLFKKFLIWRYLRKGLQINPKSDTLIFFSKTAVTIFLVFDLKLVLNMNFNLNEIYFSEEFVIWRFLTKNSSKNFPN